jgi:hypothetical protein
MFSTTLEDSKLGMRRSWRSCKTLSVVGRRRWNWWRDCTRYGSFLLVPLLLATSQGLSFRYCVPMDNARPSLDLENFGKICPDKNIDSTSKPNSMSDSEAGHDGNFPVPAIVVFTKYDQFKREINFRLEDRGLDTSTDPALLDTEAENVFNKEYLAKLTGSPPVVRLESENSVNQLACTMLISVPKECTNLANNALNLLKRLPMSSLAASLPSCSWLFRRITWSWAWD